MKSLLIGIGVVLVLLGIGAWIYQTTTQHDILWGLFHWTSTSTPYQAYALPMLIGGVVLIIVGAAVGGGKRE
jgi:hypothetical protein